MALDFIKTLFGGSESVQKAQSTSGPKDANPKEIKAMYGPLTQALKAAMAQTSDPSAQAGQVTQFMNDLGTDNLVAPVTADQQTILDYMMTDLGSRDAQIRRWAGIGQPGNLGFMLPTPGTPGYDALSGLIDARTTKLDWDTEDMLSRTLPSAFTKAGQFTQFNPEKMTGGSSAFARAIGDTAARYAQARGDIEKNVVGEYWGKATDQMQNALALGQAEFDVTYKNLEAHALNQLTKDLGIQRGLEAWKAKEGQMLEALRIAADYAQPRIATKSQSTSTGRSESTEGIVPGIASLFKGPGSAAASAPTK